MPFRTFRPDSVRSPVTPRYRLPDNHVDQILQPMKRLSSDETIGAPDPPSRLHYFVVTGVTPP